MQKKKFYLLIPVLVLAIGLFVVFVSVGSKKNIDFVGKVVDFLSYEDKSLDINADLVYEKGEDTLDFKVGFRKNVDSGIMDAYITSFYEGKSVLQVDLYKDKDLFIKLDGLYDKYIRVPDNSASYENIRQVFVNALRDNISENDLEYAKVLIDDVRYDKYSLVVGPDSFRDFMLDLVNSFNLEKLGFVNIENLGLDDKVVVSLYEIDGRDAMFDVNLDGTQVMSFKRNGNIVEFDLNVIDDEGSVVSKVISDGKIVNGSVRLGSSLFKLNAFINGEEGKSSLVKKDIVDFVDYDTISEIDGLEIYGNVVKNEELVRVLNVLGLFDILL